MRKKKADKSILESLDEVRESIKNGEWNTHSNDINNFLIVKQLKALFAGFNQKMSYNDIDKIFGISGMTASNIVNGKYKSIKLNAELLSALEMMGYEIVLQRRDERVKKLDKIKPSKMFEKGLSSNMAELEKERFEDRIFKKEL